MVFARLEFDRIAADQLLARVAEQRQKAGLTSTSRNSPVLQADRKRRLPLQPDQLVDCAAPLDLGRLDGR